MSKIKEELNEPVCIYFIENHISTCSPAMSVSSYYGGILGELEKENDKVFPKTIKRINSLQLNYLVSDYNGLLNSKDYKYVKTNFKNENMNKLSE